MTTPAPQLRQRLKPISLQRTHHILMAAAVIGASAQQAMAQPAEIIVDAAEVVAEDPNAHKFVLSSSNLSRHFSLSQNFHSMFDFAEEFVAVKIPKFVFFLIIFAFFFALACIIPPRLSEILRRMRVPANYRSALQFLLEIALVGIGLIVALAAIDIDAPGIIASVGFVTLAITLGAQTVFANISSGIAIRGNSRLVVGQEITIHQWRGKITEVGFMSVMLVINDAGDEVIVANNSFSASDIVIHKAQPTVITVGDDDTTVQVRAHSIARLDKQL